MAPAAASGTPLEILTGERPGDLLRNGSFYCQPFWSAATRDDPTQYSSAFSLTWLKDGGRRGRDARPNSLPIRYTYI
jgi:hypothetical protein